MGCGSSNASAEETELKVSASKFVVQNSSRMKDIYVLKDKLGAGAFAEVRRCKHKISGNERALKILKKTPDSESEMRSLRNECMVVKNLDHPNVLKMYEFFEDKDHFFLVTDICEGGELFDEIQLRQVFTERDTAVLMRQVLTCINYFHQQGIIHRDLKPENLLLESNKELDQIKIIDFGCSVKFKPGKPLKEVVGTPYYMAPELIFDKVKRKPIQYGPKVDVWAAGVICYILFSGEPPFSGEDDDQIFEEIKVGAFSLDGPGWDHISDDAKSFVKYLLTKDQDARPSAKEALEHPFMQMASHMSEAKVKSQAEAEGGAKQALENLRRFGHGAQLKKAANAFIASQLLSKAETEKIDQIFRALDTKGQGTLDLEEFKQGYVKYFGCVLPDEEMATIFDNIDADGSGMIDYSEFVVAAMDQRKLASRERLMATFKMFDKDGGGTISKSEIKQILSFGKKTALSQELLDKIMMEVDGDGDAQISFEEFEKIMSVSNEAEAKAGNTASI